MIRMVFGEIDPVHSNQFFLGIGATVLSIVFSLSQLDECVRIIAKTVLVGIIYTSINGMVGCRECPDFYASVFRSRPLLRDRTNPDVIAIASGIYAGWFPCLLGGFVLSFAARFPMPNTSLVFSSSQLIPYVIASAVQTFIIAHIFASIAHSFIENISDDDPFKERIIQLMALGQINPENISLWTACNTRNLIGYLSLGVGTLTLSVMTVSARYALISL